MAKLVLIALSEMLICACCPRTFALEESNISCFSDYKSSKNGQSKFVVGQELRIAPPRDLPPSWIPVAIISDRQIVYYIDRLSIRADGKKFESQVIMSYRNKILDKSIGKFICSERQWRLYDCDNKKVIIVEKHLYSDPLAYTSISDAIPLPVPAFTAEYDSEERTVLDAICERAAAISSPAQ